jgi:AMMECR1 domain-containing protein
MMRGREMITIISRYRLLIAASICLLAVLGLLRLSIAIEDPMLEQWTEFSKKPDCSKLVSWLRCQARSRLTGMPCKKMLSVTTPPFFGRLGIFITLKKGSKVRGCYGAFSHVSADIETLLSDYIIGALTRDPRYTPLDISEFDDTDIIMTITTAPSPVDDYTSVDTHRYGIVLVCGENSSIFVPAEIRSASYIKKAIAGKTCQVSAFKAVTIR